MRVEDYCKETLDQIPQNLQDAVAEYKEAIAGKELGGILNAWLDVVKRDYANFDGTVSRKDYVFFFVPAFVIGIIPILGWLIGLALLVPHIGFTIRRLRDLNLPTWLIVLYLVPLGGIVLLLLFLRKQ